MDNFNKKVIYFSLLLVGVFISSYNLNSWFYYNYNYNVPEGVETLITGNSLASNGLNPDKIPNSVNIALAAEPLVLSYYKLKDILPDSKQLKKVVVTYSILDVAYDWDDSFIDGKKNSGEMVRRLLGLKHGFNLSNVKSCFKIDYFIWWEQVFRYKLAPNLPYWIESLIIKQPDYLQIGSYNPQEGYWNASDCNFKKMAEKHFPIPADTLQPIHGKINCYLDSIIHLCSSLNLKLHIVGMPISKGMCKEIPSRYKKYYNRQIQKLDNINEVKFYNLTDIELDNGLYCDFAHLNKLGSDTLSTIVNNCIEHKNQIIVYH